MAKNTCEVITSSFKFICFIATISIIAFWLYKCYILDDDLCLVDYFPADSDEVESPILSICTENRFSDEKLKKIRPNLNSSYYLAYLQGKVMDENLTKVDYDDVSFDITDYIAGYEVRLNNGTKLESKELTKYQNPIHVTYNGFFLSKDLKKFIKCFGHSVRKEYRKEVHSIETYYNLPKVEMYSAFGRHYASVHYPNQFLASVKNMRFFLNPIFLDKKRISTRWFNVHEMEVLKRRNKRRYECLDFNDEFRFDEHVQMKHSTQFACRAPYQNLDKTRPICNTTEKMRNAAFVFNEDFDLTIHPCDSMANIRFEMATIIVPRHLQTFLTKFDGISLAIPKKVRVVKQSKAIDTNCLIGYVGGYVGVLLGKYSRNMGSLTFSMFYICMNGV